MSEIKLEDTNSYRDLIEFFKKHPVGPEGRHAHGWASGDKDHLYLKDHVCFTYNDLYIYLDPSNPQDMYITTEDVRYTPDGRRSGPYQQYLESGGKDSPEVYAAKHNSISDVSLLVEFPTKYTNGSTIMYIGDTDEDICFFDKTRSPYMSLTPVGIDEYDLLSAIRFRTYIESTISSEAGFEEIIEKALEAPDNQNINKPRFKREKGLYEKALRICESLRVILKEVNDRLHKEITPDDTQAQTPGMIAESERKFEQFKSTQKARLNQYGTHWNSRSKIGDAVYSALRSGTTTEEIENAMSAEHEPKTPEAQIKGGNPDTHDEQ